jgi:hypothetical protein
MIDWTDTQPAGSTTIGLTLSEAEKRFNSRTGSFVYERETLGFALIDQDELGMFTGTQEASFNPGGLFATDAKYTPAGGHPQAWIHRTDATPAGNVFKLQRLLNPESDGVVAIVFDNSIREFSKAARDVGVTPANYQLLTRQFGGAVGRTIAHEFAHALGLPDEYVLNPALEPAYAGFSSSGLMTPSEYSAVLVIGGGGGGNSIDTGDLGLTDFQKAMIALGLDEPVIADRVLDASLPGTYATKARRLIDNERSLILLQRYNAKADDAAVRLTMASGSTTFAIPASASSGRRVRCKRR